MKWEPDDPRVGRVWRWRVQTDDLSDGTWRAWYPGLEWSVAAPSEEEAKEKAVEEAIRRREDADAIARNAAKMSPPLNREFDDPRRGRAWQFTPQAEELSDGTWRAWYPSGGWSVTAPTEQEAKDKALRESVRRRDDSDEIARKVAIMRRHLVEPVPGVSMLDKSE